MGSASEYASCNAVAPVIHLYTVEVRVFYADRMGGGAEG